MRAFLFPGQGSQYVGMGSDFLKKFDSVKSIFQKVDETLGFSLSQLILEGPEDKLKLTQNTQPAIMAVGVSIFNILKENKNYDPKQIKFFAGHSLGEYTALVCAGSITLERAAYLLHERGKAMQQAVPEGLGSMMAVIGMKISEVENEINNLPKTKEDVCEIANDNSDNQVVVSGTKNIIQKLNTNLKNKKKKGIVLPVSAPFHCSLMSEASKIMEEKIKSTNFLKPNTKIISNVTAKEVEDVDKIKSLLIEQITSRVRWRESVNYMIKQGVTDFTEIGPGKVLSGLVKKISNNVKVLNINSLEDV
tara:strand:+ start:699 stop:1616 length:918 start_codon:yes stop_codon:yes gene_type:complete